jgi:hypothetical protein
VGNHTASVPQAHRGADEGNGFILSRGGGESKRGERKEKNGNDTVLEAKEEKEIELSLSRSLARSLFLLSSLSQLPLLLFPPTPSPA